MLMYHVPSLTEVAFLGIFVLIAAAFYLRRMSRIRTGILAALDLKPITKSDLITRLAARRIFPSEREFLRTAHKLEKGEGSIIVSMDATTSEMTYALHPHHSYVMMRITNGEIRVN